MASFSLDNPISGHCNCGSITVDLKAGQEISCSVCHCFNCRRSGGGYSVNYLIGENDLDIKDPQTHMKGYDDSNTHSGNQIKRNFCGNCGSPVYSASPVMCPGRIFLKASLFDSMAQPTVEVFARNRETWQIPAPEARLLENES